MRDPLRLPSISLGRFGALALVSVVGGITGCAAPASAAPARTASTEARPPAKHAPAVAAAAPIDPSTMPKQRAIVLRAARLFDGKGDNVVEGGVAVVVENGLIANVGRASSVAAPADATVIDLGDSTLLPGFIDAHTHVSFESSDDFYRDTYQFLHRFPAEQAHYAAASARKILDAGFTTVRDLGSAHLLDVGLRNAIQDEQVTGPRMLVAVHAIGATGGHADDDPYPPAFTKEPGPFEGICNGADMCRMAVREQVKYGADIIKVMASGGVLSLADAVDTPQLTPDELSAIVEEAHHLGKKVAAHCHGDTAAKLAVQAGVDSIEHGSFLKPDTLAFMKSKGTVLIPTFLAGASTGAKIDKFPPAIQVKARAANEAHANMFKAALRSGVIIGFGTDSAVSRHGINAQEFALMTADGMAPAAALRAATSVNATLLGIQAQTGTLDKGKLADIVAVPGNPLKDIKQTEHVHFVMRAGRISKRPEIARGM
ncbi:amidohydrolase family protein [Pendulispora albinea]|uniref:Amidohydrolase family protein n=1 Tax=Pendulispora albinea TaxID=2741071 RepID=A0ABZ2LPC3_9BACT